MLPSYTGKVNETPHGTKCSATLGSITFDVNDCHFKLTGSTTGSDSGTDATVWIECPTGQSIQTTGPLGCTISIPSQTPTSGGVTYTNLPNHPGGAAIEVKETITGITYTATEACSLAGIPTHGNDATTTGTVTLTGYVDNNANTTDLTTVNEGAQTPVSVS